MTSTRKSRRSLWMMTAAAGLPRRTRYSAVAVGVLLFGMCFAADAALTATELTFDRYEVSLGDAKRSTVLTGSFLVGPAAAVETLTDSKELAVVDLDESRRPRVRMYGFDRGVDEEWVPRLDAELGSGVLFVDVARCGDLDRLITYERGRLNWFDSESGNVRPLVEFAPGRRARRPEQRQKPTKAPREPEIPHIDVTRDLNGDGCDDIVLPDFDGFWISLQSLDGSFSEFVKIGPPEPFLEESSFDDKRSYGEVGFDAQTIPWYLSRVRQMDFDRDGRDDLVFWNQDHFDVYLQNEDGQFNSVPETVATDVPFDSDGTYSLLFGFSGKSTFKLLFGLRKSVPRTALHSIRDLNGDGVADLVTLTLSGRSILKQRSVYKVYFGRPTPGGTSFPRDAGPAIRPRGRAGGIQASGYSSQWLQDLDGDGRVEIGLRDIQVGPAGMARAMVGNSVGINLEFYRMEAESYPETPTDKRKIRRFAPFAGIGNVFLPPILLGDVNGDGLSDLLVGKNPEEMQIFVGVPAPELFALEPQKLAVSLPPDERHSRLVDLDQDGKEDLLVHHVPTRRDPTNPQRLTLLLAR